jgi:YjbE family integral membrane protein
VDGALMNRAAIDGVLLIEIVGVNFLLSGDNAVVVGMSVRDLSPALRRIASAAGIGVAVLLQIAATLTVARLLKVRLVLLAAGVTLCTIAIRLLRQDGVKHQLVDRDPPYHDLPSAILTVAAAYFASCLDNILGVAAVGRDHPGLLTIGLLLSSAAIVPASLGVAGLMRRYPITLTIGAGIVGWVAGSLLAEAASPLDQALPGRVVRVLIPVAITLMVVSSPIWLREWKGR